MSCSYWWTPAQQQMFLCSRSCRLPPTRGVGRPCRRSHERLRRRATGEEYFDEGAAQVKRLLDRDRKEVLKQDQKAEYDAEFDRPEGPSKGSNGSGASTSQPSAFEEELSSMKNPMQKAFKSPPRRGAFGSSAKSPFGSDSASSSGRQADMWANMEAVEEDEAPWWTQISFAQVAIVFSFLTVIGLMLATTWVTVKLGGVHFNE